MGLSNDKRAFSRTAADIDHSLSALKASAEEQGCLLRESGGDDGKHSRSFGIF